MSIATAITTAQGRVANAYTAVSTKGGTLPATQNLANLPDAILSISGGGGATVEAKAITVTDAVAGDKVLLIPTGVLLSDETFVGTSTSSLTTKFPLKNPGPQTDYRYVRGIGFTDASTSYLYMTGTWNSSLSDITSYSTSSFGRYLISYRDEIPFTAFMNENYGYLSSLGVFENGAYTPLTTPTTSYTDPANVFGYVSGKFVVGYNYGDISGSEGNWQVNRYTANTNYTVLPSKYNNTWYIIENDTVYEWGTSTSFASFSPGWDHTTRTCGFSFIDDNVDYIFVISESGSGSGFYKINKNSSAWTTTLLDEPTEVISEAIQGGITTRNNRSSNYITCVMQAKDYGTYVDIYMATSEFGYDGEGAGNKIARFKFVKATETLTRLPDVFLDYSDPDHPENTVLSFSVNFEEGLISAFLMDRSSSTKYTSLVTKKIDEMAGIYEYYAYSPDKEYYYDHQSITGFVKSNDGVNDLGDTVLTVETVKDPTTPPWSNIGIVFGMDIIVNEGVPV